jgi:DNA ligase-1
MIRFTKTCDAVAATTKKTEKVRLVSELLQSLPVEDATRAAIFLTGRPFPRWDERVLGVGGMSLARLIGELSGATGEAMATIYQKHGDLGNGRRTLGRPRLRAGHISR